MGIVRTSSTALLVLLAGCNQILGIEDAVVVAPDGSANADAAASIDDDTSASTEEPFRPDTTTPGELDGGKRGDPMADAGDDTADASDPAACEGQERCPTADAGGADASPDGAVDAAMDTPALCVDDGECTSPPTCFLGGGGTCVRETGRCVYQPVDCSYLDGPDGCSQGTCNPLSGRCEPAAVREDEACGAREACGDLQCEWGEASPAGRCAEVMDGAVQCRELRCRAGSCQPTGEAFPRVRPGACTRDTDATPCDTTCGAVECSWPQDDAADRCATRTDGTRQCQSWACSSGVCVATGDPDPQVVAGACARETEGDVCGTPSYENCGVCAPSNGCGQQQGLTSCEQTTPVCEGGACAGVVRADRVPRSCTPGEGTPCASTETAAVRGACTYQACAAGGSRDCQDRAWQCSGGQCAPRLGPVYACDTAGCTRADQSGLECDRDSRASVRCQTSQCGGGGSLLCRDRLYRCAGGDCPSVGALGPDYVCGSCTPCDGCRNGICP